MVVSVLFVSVSSFRRPGVMLAVFNRALSDKLSMLTGMSMVRAAPENRMQQHRRYRQNAG